jgi:cell division protein FtsB
MRYSKTTEENENLRRENARLKQRVRELEDDLQHALFELGGAH